MNEMYQQPLAPRFETAPLPRTQAIPKTFRVRVWVGVVALMFASVVGGLAGAVGAMKGGAFFGAPDNHRPAAAAPAPNVDQALANGGFSPIVNAALPAVVNISTSKVTKTPQNPIFDNPFFREFFGEGQRPPREQKENSLGSGVVISPDGYILTNNHVIEGATDIRITFSDKREAKAKLVGTDPKTDIAVLKVEEKGLTALPIGDSSKVNVGDFALAIGNPFGLGQTVTLGIVSAKGRGNLRIEDYEDFIQTDAAINPGNSGGALVNTRGELVGINTAILSRGNSGGNQGIGFAVPVNMAKTVMDQLIKNGRVIRGYLGLSLQDVDPKLAKALNLKDNKGAVVASVQPESPASRAGFQPGDVIVELNGQPVTEVRTLRLSIAGMAPGTSVSMKVVREGGQIPITAKLEELPNDQPLASSENDGPGDEPNPTEGGSLDGVVVGDLSPQLRQRLNLPSGVVVRGIRPGSPADEAGLQRDDVIVQVNRKPVTNSREYDAAVKANRSNDLLLLVNRGGTTTFVVVQLK